MWSFCRKAVLTTITGKHFWPLQIISASRSLFCADRLSRRLDRISFVIFKWEWILEDGQLKWKNHYVNSKLRVCLAILATISVCVGVGGIISQLVLTSALIHLSWGGLLRKSLLHGRAMMTKWNWLGHIFCRNCKSRSGYKKQVRRNTWGNIITA